MVATVDGDAWLRLGELLRQRRVQIAGHGNRTQFARDKGLPNDRTLFDLEKGRRNNYSAAQLDLMEIVYGWTPGSIRAVLAGGEPTPLPEIADVKVATPESDKRTELRLLVEQLPEDSLDEALVHLFRILHQRTAHAGEH